MSDAFYRDPLAGFRSIIETKRAQATDLGHVVTPLAWALATPAERTAIAALRARCQVEPADVTVASEIDGKLDALVAALEQLIAAASAFGTRPLAEVSVPRPAGARTAWLSDDALFAHHDALEARVQQLLGASLELWGTGYIARGPCGVLPIAYGTEAKITLHGTFESELRVAIGRLVDDAHDMPRVKTALDELASRHAHLIVSSHVATITWTSTDHEQAHDPIPWEAIAAVAAVHLAAR